MTTPFVNVTEEAVQKFLRNFKEESTINQQLLVQEVYARWVEQLQIGNKLFWDLMLAGIDYGVLKVIFQRDLELEIMRFEE